MNQHFRNYKKDLDYSYTLGVFLTIELLQNKPEQAFHVVADHAALKNSGLDKIKELCCRRNIPFEINDKLVHRLSPKDNCYVIGFFHKFAHELAKERNHIILVHPMDSGNLGTIIRTSLGFNFNDIAIVRPSVDVFDPKTIRSSMGAVFSTRFAFFDSIHDYLLQYSDHHFYPFMLQGKGTVSQAAKNKVEPFSLVFGNESSGLPDEFLHMGTSVLIPHSGQIDSLNLSIAVGIAEYAFSDYIIW